MSRAIISLGIKPSRHAVVSVTTASMAASEERAASEAGESTLASDGRRRTEPDEEVVRRDGLECPSRRTTPPSRGEQSERTCLKHRDSHDVLSSGSGDLDAEYKDEVGREDQRRLSRCPTFCAGCFALAPAALLRAEDDELGERVETSTQLLGRHLRPPGDRYRLRRATRSSPLARRALVKP